MITGSDDAEPLQPRNIALSDEAIDWIVRLGSGSATSADRAAFDAWRARSPAHGAAADEATAILGDVAASRQASTYHDIGDAIRMAPPVAERRLSRRSLLGGAGAAILAAGIVLTTDVGRQFAAWHADHATGVGERRRIAFPDGSRVWLNTSTAIGVAFTPTERRIHLLAGEALFAVAHDPSRPFIVRSGDGEARAVGTVYSVRRRRASSEVVVRQGAVDVRNGAESARLTAGQSMAYAEDVQGPVRTVDATRATAWIHGKLIFNRRPLQDVAAELERHHHGWILIRGERLKRRAFTGVFDLDDRDAALRMIGATAGVPVTVMPFLAVIG